LGIGFSSDAHRANSNAITASNAHTLAKPISSIRLIHARVGMRASCAYKKSRSSSIAAKSARARSACRKASE
jgi:hypothetical protein